jgi:polysaccharide biosynthesis/export protein ExoF
MMSPRFKIDRATHLCVAFGALAALSVVAPAALVAAADSDCGPKTAPADQANTARTDPNALSRGDKVRLSFYEIMPSQEEKWGADRQRVQAAKAFQLRPELSSEYVVQEDRTISIPMLGSFVVERRKAADVRKQLECAFDEFLGHKGYVNVVGIVKSPIYVVGSVRASGSFPFTPGMTVLHAVSLAGGFERRSLEPFQIAELTRETDRLRNSFERAVKMMARTVAIASARNAESVKPPPELAALAGGDQAAALVAEQAVVPRREAHLRGGEETALKAELNVATSELAARRSKMPLLEQAIGLRRQRFENLKKLSQNGSLSQPVVIQAQTEMLDAQDRREQSVAAIDAAQERLNRVQRDLARQQTQGALDDQRSLQAARNDAERDATDGVGSLNVIRSIIESHVAAGGSANMQFTIVRQSDAGPLQVLAEPTTVLEPGDLVEVKGRNDAPTTLTTSRR